MKTNKLDFNQLQFKKDDYGREIVERCDYR